MAKTRAEHTRWVSYLRVSTVDQAEKELSLTAQRHSAEEFAARHDAVIDHDYVEAGASGADAHRPVFNELLGDALRPGSTISTIVVHHTSRFTRDATHARVVKPPDKWITLPVEPIIDARTSVRKDSRADTTGPQQPRSSRRGGTSSCATTISAGPTRSTSSTTSMSTASAS